MRRLICILGIVFLIACARVQVETKEPIRVDINMRLDVYQHVAEEVDSIESEVFENRKKPRSSIFALPNAYAAGYSDEVTQAIERRKNRVAKIEEYFEKGYIGESRDGNLRIVDKSISQDLYREVDSLITSENKDREVVYKAVAEKDGVALSEVRKVFFEDHYKRAPAGYWFEVYDSSQGKFIWLRK